jgi:hypothetical protein
MFMGSCYKTAVVPARLTMGMKARNNRSLSNRQMPIRNAANSPSFNQIKIPNRHLSWLFPPGRLAFWLSGQKPSFALLGGRSDRQKHRCQLDTPCQTVLPVSHRKHSPTPFPARHKIGGCFAPRPGPGALSTPREATHHSRISNPAMYTPNPDADSQRCLS